MRGLRPARKDLIVDSEETDHAGRNAADRFQRAKGHAALKEISALLHGRELLGEVMTHHAKIDVRFGVRGLAKRSQPVDAHSQEADIPKLIFADWVEKLLDYFCRGSTQLASGRGCSKFSVSRNKASAAEMKRPRTSAPSPSTSSCGRMPSKRCLPLPSMA